jgi:phosphomannomutase
MPEAEAQPAQPSSLKFGTSGLRGLVADLEGQPARDWTAAFLAHLEASGEPARRLLVGRDLRASSPLIAQDCMAAAANKGWQPVNCGTLPTPALALLAGEEKAPAVMVTGSHIPDNRNGLKFYAAAGEITKADEAGILSAWQAGAGGQGRGRAWPLPQPLRQLLRPQGACRPADRRLPAEFGGA